jgi:hypothetical protein
MTTTGLILAVLFIGLYAALRFVSRPQFRWTFLSATAIAILVYAAHIVLGGIVLVLAIDHDRLGAGGYAIAFAGWFVLGVLDLIRTVPRNREPPAWLMKPGIADAICLIVIVTGLALAWG